MQCFTEPSKPISKPNVSAVRTAHGLLHPLIDDRFSTIPDGERQARRTAPIPCLSYTGIKIDTARLIEIQSV